MMSFERIDLMLEEMQVPLAEYELIVNNYMPNFQEFFILELEKAEFSQNRDKIKNSKDETTFGFEPSNAGKGGSEKAQLKGKTFENVFEWMNFQKKVKRK